MIFSKIYRIFHLSNNKNTIPSAKENIRQEIRLRKKNLTEDQKKQQAETVFKKIEHMQEFINANTILMYWSMPDELPTHDFIKKWSHSKSVLLPVVKGHHMTIRPFSSEAELVRGNWKVMEPLTSNDYLKTVDLVIVPGIAFDRRRVRLGRGKGFYDRFLKKKNLVKWGICYDFQLYENIPSASFDIKMNKIITASEII